MVIGGSSAMIEYIRSRGYVSYSSLKKLRDGEAPGYTGGIHFDVGTETHSRWLEKKIGKKFDPENERIIRGMVKALDADRVACALLKGSAVEVEFNKIVSGVKTHGFIDILPPPIIPYLGDLKTTKETSRQQFIKSMDFLQVALYLLVANKKDFYYVGVSKVNFQVFTFRVSDYPDRLKIAQDELKTLLTYVKKEIGK